MSETQIVIVWLAGVGFLLIETFLPGAVAGIVGAIACTVAVMMAFLYIGVLVGAGMLVASLVVGLGGAWYATRQLGLRHQLDAETGFVATEDLRHLVGQKGETLTVLRPAGFARIDGKRVDVVTDGEHLGPGTVVVVGAVEGNRVIVRSVSAGG